MAISENKNTNQADDKKQMPDEKTRSDETPSFEEWRASRKKGKKSPNLMQRMKTSRFALTRGIYRIIHTTGIIFMAIGAFIAWLIGFLLI